MLISDLSINLELSICPGGSHATPFKNASQHLNQFIDIAKSANSS